MNRIQNKMMDVTVAMSALIDAIAERTGTDTDLIPPDKWPEVLNRICKLDEDKAEAFHEIVELLNGGE